MAGEVKGKIYEAIVKIALERALSRSKSDLNVFWHEQPEWITIEADLAVGPDSGAIEILIMITHSISEKLSEKKFWRNAGEHFQWKVHGLKPITCYSIVFDATFKPGLMSLSHIINDGELIVEEKSYGQTLIDYVDQHLGDFGDTDSGRELHVLHLCDKCSDCYELDFEQTIRLLSIDIGNLLKRGNKSELSSLWECMRKIDRRRGKIKKQSKLTSVRNGLAKLMLFPPHIRSKIFNFVRTGEPVDSDDIPSFLEDLNLVKVGLDEQSFEIEDQDIISCAEILGEQSCEQVIKMAPNKMQDFAYCVQCVENVDVYTDFIIENYNILITPEGMNQLLVACYKNPAGLLEKVEKVKYPPIDTWLFPYCMTIEKAKTGKVLAYGLSKLAKDTGIRKIGSGGFLIPPFIYRQKLLAENILSAISKVFADQLLRAGSSLLNSIKFRNSMKAMLLQRNHYILSNYKQFEPLRDLVLLQLKKSLIPFKLVKINTALSEFSGSSAATSEYIYIPPDTLIYWQSVTEAGRIHKTKELSARFRATKVRWNGKTFLPRSSANHIFFIADGEWHSDDFDMLIRSGIDAIFYPDEIDLLIDHIHADKDFIIDEFELPMAAESKEPIFLKPKRKNSQIRKSKAN